MAQHIRKESVFVEDNGETLDLSRLTSRFDGRAIAAFVWRAAALFIGGVSLYGVFYLAWDANSLLVDDPALAVGIIASIVIGIIVLVLLKTVWWLLERLLNL